MQNKWQISYRYGNTTTVYNTIEAWKVSKGSDTNQIVIDDITEIFLGEHSIIKSISFIIDEPESFDGIEISPVRYDKISDSWEVCKRSEAHAWSVYLHYVFDGKQGGVTCIADFDTKNEALDMAHDLLNRYQSLRINEIDPCDCEICHKLKNIT